MKRGQSALEYLMTYGWALVIILIAAAALYAMGLLSPATYQQKTCTGFTAFGYQDHMFNGTDFTVRLGNEMGGNMRVTSIEITVDDLETENTTYSPGQMNINAGSIQNLIVDGFTAATFPAGSNYVAEVVITYDAIGGISGHVDRGSCTGNVE